MRRTAVRPGVLSKPCSTTASSSSEVSSYRFCVRSVSSAVSASSGPMLGTA
ncbi:hypothetical protein SGLAM104S_04196 [Streptomyces glaucescens]